MWLLTICIGTVVVVPPAIEKSCTLDLGTRIRSATSVLTSRPESRVTLELPLDVCVTLSNG